MKVSLENLRFVILGAAGLSSDDVEMQRLRFGRNHISESFQQPYLQTLASTCKDPMIVLLLASGTLFLSLGKKEESLILYISILPLVLMDIYLHYRTQASTRKLRAQLNRKSLVRRDGKTYSIDSEEVVPGDIILLKPGEVLAADGYFEKAYSVQIDESMLTGESMPVGKEAWTQKANENEISVEMNFSCFGFAGTRVIRGEAEIRVVRTGAFTQYGEILVALEHVPTESTPLQKTITQLVQILSSIGFALCVILASVRLYLGHGWLDALLSGAILAVAAMPEEFPIVFSFYLGVGVYRLAKVKALVKRAVTVENIGRVTMICTDKTGTLTLGELRLMDVLSPANVLRKDVLKAALISSNDSDLDPVDAALRKSGEPLLALERIQIYPFTELRKKQTAIIWFEDTFQCSSKGAPEEILKMCALEESENHFWMDQVSRQAQRGTKVLACAVKELRDFDGTEPIDGFQFMGLLVFADPVRPEVKGAIQFCQKQNIKVLMLTGDHLKTALAIANEIGLGSGVAKGISMPEDPQVVLDLNQIDVLARCSPLQKLRIVDYLKRPGETVVVTGDGFNDVPALQKADIGIAMGKRGSREARDVSAIVLADDNFATIVNAIKEGRQLFQNLKISFEYLLLIQGPFVLGAALVPLLGYPLLYLPPHLVWLELIIHPTSLFAFQKASTDDAPVSLKTQNRWTFFSTRHLVSILLESVAVLTALIVTYAADLSRTGSETFARANAMSIMIFMSGGIVWRFTRLRTLLALVICFLTTTISVILVQNQIFAKYLYLEPLGFFEWLRNGVVVFGILSLRGILKKV